MRKSWETERERKKEKERGERERDREQEREKKIDTNGMSIFQNTMFSAAEVAANSSQI